MNFELETLDLSAASKQKCDALIVLITSHLKPGKDVLSLLVAQALKAGDLQAKPGKTLALYRPVGLACVRAVLAHAGEGSAHEVSRAVKSAVAAAKADNVKKLVICFAAATLDAPLRAAVIAAAEASYVFTTTKSRPQGRVIERVLIGVSNSSALKPVFDRAAAAVTGIEFAKEWANRPANHATPELLAGAAHALAKLPNIKCEVLGPKQVHKLGMGAFMAVAQGSQEPLRFIVLRYHGALKSEAPTVLVGKGVTFDSGGISIKPAADMDEMKFDMSGAASVLGVFRALAELKPAINVVGLIPACENLLDGRSIKPGDVVTSMSGQTIEILNTDAEGRLVLCDALTYAERFKPRAVVDIATLTGACVIALGGVRSGLFSTNDELAAALISAGQASLDLCWRMPLDDDYAEGLKTNFADVANVAGRAGGAITAAKFLQRFTEKFPWAHLDIAGTAWKSGKEKGATGRPVALLLEYLLDSTK
ncbi:MAG: leucyl aminopeptidase [Gammaproteobacteria bacterium]|uniref:leucyl aminopeptidase n=1 Tax=Rhodoferax sp. TaxID=50421 RepID=UPI0017D48C6B|nr:leucyl aminopeptidase [Rhodoferax sp.]MBU3899862.1 leucyl aminopeptidase [Gammaproteobacteria bacterium]MBA3058197.1 leucyl aminopeptidase [Rhodoferax sp.]MBU3996045.1 leucyl aminopeptidase [Gammaproteobacteria bacterium]MBU4019127.1 leucyl aminopeptidase [Gammaproteobacteria bacterium]MBU4078845.1 leucyl aminopeptidase [Gammaproteobacteria bacterium]